MSKDKEDKKRNGQGGFLFGIILIVLGLIFLLGNYGFSSFDFGKLWPLFVIIPGIYILYNRSK